MFNNEPDFEDENNDDDWMTTLLKSPIFSNLPPANLQQIIIKLEEIEYEKGELIISQGDSGDFYYLIKHGQCLLSRKPTPGSKEIKLGQLSDHDTFGEDSLLSGEPRNVNITALTDISLLRLSKDNFISLIKKPSLQFIDNKEIEEQVRNGATLLDVRTTDEYKKNHIPDSINVPFFSLRMQLKSFDRENPIIVVCANGKTSEAAAFLLLRHHISTLIVDGGMEKVAGAIETVQAEKPEQASETKKTDNSSIDAKKTTEISELPKANSKYNKEPVKESKPTISTESSADIQAQQSVLEKENQQLKQDIQNLITEKDDMEANHLSLSQQYESKQSNLEIKNKQLQQEIEKVLSKKGDLERKQLTSQQQTEMEQASFEKENKKLTLDIEKLIAKKDDFKEKYLGLNKEVEAQQASLKKENQKLTQDNKELSAEKDSLETKYLELDKEVEAQQANLKEENQKLTQDNKELSAEKDSLEAKNLNLNKEAEAQQATLEKENQQLAQNIEQSNAERDSLEKKHLASHKQSKAEESTLGVENQALTEKIEILSSEKKDLEKKYLTLNEQSEAQSSTLENENQKLTQVTKKLIAEKKSLETKIISLSKQSEAKGSDLEVEHQKLILEKDKLQTKFDTLYKENEKLKAVLSTIEL